MPRWTIADSADLYGIRAWGDEFFAVNDEGHATIRPEGTKGGELDLYALTQELVERGVDTPVLLRFTDIIAKRMERFAKAFGSAFADHGYQGRYRGVYPIKVNQQYHLVRDLVQHGRSWHFGLEAGSKPELLVTLALMDDPEALIICNGYRDANYIRTALLSRKLGRNTIIVVEKLTEVALILKVAEQIGVTPAIGVRAKLSRPGKGKWKTSSGDRAKFGLTPQEIVSMVRTLEAHGQLDALRLLHFHIGSQVTSIRTFKEAMKEASRTYVELVRMGAKMGIMDVGGGLGVDYDGSRTDFESSRNYSEEEYAADVVYSMGQACDAAGVPHPDIVTEAGRAMVAHHSVLVFDVKSVAKLIPTTPIPEIPADAPRPSLEMLETLKGINSRNYQEAWHDVLQYREDALQAYNLGMLNLEQRAIIEELFWHACSRIRKAAEGARYVSDDLDGLSQLMADTYYCNFSVFQSVPDAWAIDQLFPVMPLQRLDEEPKRRAILADLTCDSDGKLDRFVDLRDVKTALPLHAIRSDEPYYLGIYMVGAYQEILGDLHNLFGDTNAAHVSLSEDGTYNIDDIIEGDTVREVLSYVQYETRVLVENVRKTCENAIKRGSISRPEAKKLLSAYQRALEGYTYLGH